MPSKVHSRPRRTSGVLAALLSACALGCLPDPKQDPCRDPGASDCELDGSSEPDGSGDELDASLDADTQPGTDAANGIPDGGLPREAGADGSLGTPDAAVDATIPDATASQDPNVLPLEGELGVHDPAIIEANGGFIILSTGRGIPVKRSSDLLTWENAGRVFDTNPAWVAQQVPGATDLWAPDIAYYGGKYHLYYSASTFGSRDSCIGHATATDLSTLNFVDQGPVICTEQTDDYNAIDPGFIVDDSGTAWLSFGSFWSGIKMIRLDANGQRAGSALHSLASRNVQAVEAPFIVRRGSYYYLFVSFDYCCRGVSSTYRIMVGRSTNVTGPYVDAEGKPMLNSGGGTGVVLGNQRWRGPGHNSVLTRAGGDQYLVYHSYDAENNGLATLRISDLLWNSAGWPIPTGP